MSALDTQVGGDHYKDRGIQPVVYIHANKLDFFQGNVVKYVTRWREKGGVPDLEKAKHYLEMYIELENKRIEGMNIPGTVVEFTDEEHQRLVDGESMASVISRRT